MLMLNEHFKFPAIFLLLIRFWSLSRDFQTHRETSPHEATLEERSSGTDLAKRFLFQERDAEDDACQDKNFNEEGNNAYGVTEGSSKAKYSCLSGGLSQMSSSPPDRSLADGDAER